MPFTFTPADRGEVSGGVSSIVSALISPAAGDIVFVALHSSDLQSSPTISGLGLSWSKDAQFDAGPDFDDLVVWIGTGTPSSGQITINAGGVDTFARAQYHVTICSGGGGKVQSATGTTALTDGTITVNFPGAWSPGSAGLQFMVLRGGATTATPRAGWTELDDSTSGSTFSMESAYRTTSDTAGGAAFAGATSEYRAGYVVEISPAAAGGSTDGLASNQTQITAPDPEQVIEVRGQVVQARKRGTIPVVVPPRYTHVSIPVVGEVSTDYRRTVLYRSRAFVGSVGGGGGGGAAAWMERERRRRASVLD